MLISVATCKKIIIRVCTTNEKVESPNFHSKLRFCCTLNIVSIHDFTAGLAFKYPVHYNIVYIHLFNIEIVNTDLNHLRKSYLNGNEF